MQIVKNLNDTVIGNYRISKTIGQGTFGKVKLGIHQPTGEKVAIKILQKDKIVENSDMERITREICILKLLRHPNIIQLYEILETKRNIYLIMEYAEGGELFNYIVKKKKIGEIEAVTFMQQILSGVEYLHKNCIAHRDLKPQNLLLDHKKNIKIVDFGLSNQYRNGDKLSTACGSPCYAAPQMIAGKDYYGSHVDIWSCGIIMYALLCGYLPFEDPNTNKLYKKIISGHYQVPSVLTKEAQQLLRCILNIDWQKRYKIEEIRHSKWYNLVSDCTINNKGIIVEKDRMQINFSVIQELQKYKIQTNNIVQYLQNNKHNPTTAAYYLLLRKFQRQNRIQICSYRHPRQNDLIKPYDFVTRKKQKTQINDMNESLTFQQIRNAFLTKKQTTPTSKINFNPKFKHSYNHDYVSNANNDSTIANKASEGKHLTDSGWMLSSRKTPKLQITLNNFSKKQNLSDDRRNTTINLEQLKNFSKYTSRKPLKKDEQLINNSISYELASPKSANFKSPPLHVGPFNSRCLFEEDPQNLFKNIKQFFTRELVCFQTDPTEIDLFTVKIDSKKKIWIQTLEQTSGIYLVMFDHKSSLNDRLLNYLEAH